MRRLEIKLGAVSIHLAAGVAVADVTASLGFQHVKLGLDGIARLMDSRDRIRGSWGQQKRKGGGEIGVGEKRVRAKVGPEESRGGNGISA